MKRILAIFLALCAVSALAGCSGTAAVTTTGTTTTTTAETTTAEATTTEATTAPAGEVAEKYYGALNYGGTDEAEITAFHLALSRLAGNKDWPDGGAQEQWHARLFDDLNSALLALSRGDIAQMELMAPVANYVTAHNPAYAKLDLFSTGRSALAMAVLDSNPALLQALNVALRSLANEGVLAKLEREYLADPRSEPIPADLPMIPGAETVRVLVTGDLPPFDYVTAGGLAAGYNVALLSALSRKMNVNIQLIYGNAGSRFIQLISGKADVVFWAKGVTFLEGGDFDFSADLPQGVAITDIYTTQDNSSLVCP